MKLYDFLVDYCWENTNKAFAIAWGIAAVLGSIIGYLMFF
jgi:hypothetical protein